MRTIALLIGALAASTATRNGFYLSFTGESQVAGMVGLTLDATNTEIAKLATGFTIMYWMKIHGDASDRPYINVQMMRAGDGNFMQPFAGKHGGWQFGSGSPKTVSTLSDNGKDWHHYAIAWDPATGARSHYIDGTLLVADSAAAGTAFINDQLTIIMGMNCYPSSCVDPP